MGVELGLPLNFKKDTPFWVGRFWLPKNDPPPFPFFVGSKRKPQRKPNKNTILEILSKQKATAPIPPPAAHPNNPAPGATSDSEALRALRLRRGRRRLGGLGPAFGEAPAEVLLRGLRETHLARRSRSRRRTSAPARKRSAGRWLSHGEMGGFLAFEPDKAVSLAHLKRQRVFCLRVAG